MSIARDLIVSLMMKFKMLGVLFVELANHFCDNTVVVKNTNIPEWTLSKRCNSISNLVVKKLLKQE